MSSSLATRHKKRGGNKKIKIFEGSCLRDDENCLELYPTCLYFVLETNLSSKMLFSPLNVAPFMFGKNKSRKSKNERRYSLFWKRFLNTKNRYLKRNSNF